jgi:hypothetical protein
MGTGSNIDPEAGIASLLTDNLEIADTGDDEITTNGTDGQAAQAVRSADDESLETQSDEQSDQSEEAYEADVDSEDQADTAEPMYTVNVDGKSMQVPQSELINGYQRHADYSRKTQALAETRKAVDADRTSFETERQAVSQERTHYKALLGQLQSAIAQLEPQQPTPEQWARLQQDDPTQFLIARENWRVVNDQKQAAQAELHRLQTQEQAQHQQAFAAHAQKAAQTFRESIPAWKDEAVGRRELGELVSYARSVGYSDDEIRAAADPRALKSMYMAMKFEALQSNAKTLKPVAKAKTMAAGSPARPVSQSNRSNATKRLTRTGSPDDLASILETMDL